MKKGRFKKNFEFEGNEIEYAWAKNKLTVCSHVSPSAPQLVFQVFNSNGLQDKNPEEFAKEVYAAAVTAGAITSAGSFRDSLFDINHGFYAHGPTISAAGMQRVGVFLKSVIFKFKPSGID